jgi:hypothetical protein
MKPSKLKVLEAIFKDPKGSDRKLARNLAVSQPTVTRQRADLFLKGYFKYVAVPNLGKLGYKVIAISETTQTLGKDALSEDSVIFALKGVHSVLLLHKHKDFDEYCDFCAKYEVENSIPASANKGILKNITFDKP